ncbi:hypothetical protein T11_4515 [Trichinella zimbabwensis]|uniref:Uncharacterized protein n=1 Tax=Trichinella zimbabwensis TaxID=268475 RepID=A0A0V1G6T1_9BILA|nr:hypothetical protein T11_4515 [Trichinella zimbabwensis]
MPFSTRIPVPCAPRRRANKLLHFYKEGEMPFHTRITVPAAP